LVNTGQLFTSKFFLSTYTFSALTLLVGWVAGRESGL